MAPQTQTGPYCRFFHNYRGSQMKLQAVMLDIASPTKCVTSDTLFIFTRVSAQVNEWTMC